MVLRQLKHQSWNDLQVTVNHLEKYICFIFHKKTNKSRITTMYVIHTKYMCQCVLFACHVNRLFTGVMRYIQNEEMVKRSLFGEMYGYGGEL